MIETRAVAVAIRAELGSVEETLTHNSNSLIAKPPTEFFFVPDLAHSVRMFPRVVEKIGLLADPSIITEVVGTYIVIDQYCENLLMAGGELGKHMPEHRRIIVMPHNRAEFVAKMNAQLAKDIRNTMNLLNRFLP
jgi:hypothetical protein